jgi:phosphoribosylformimino-5-aminoimidazole carboxamide ribotide isomerase
MILFPAIDLKDGHCVRLTRGDLDTATVFNDDPAAQARAFADAGFKWLHCIDLNGAFEGVSVNAAAVRAIRAAVNLPIQLGGGIRDMKAVEAWLAAGITRVILGTVALTNPSLVKEAARAFPGRIVVAADARGGRIATEGWSETTELTPAELSERFEGFGVAAVLYTDVDRDGLMRGLNVPATAALAHKIALPVIASGGVSGIADIKALVEANEPNIEGVVIGRALYDGRLSAAEALSVANSIQ